MNCHCPWYWRCGCHDWRCGYHGGGFWGNQVNCYHSSWTHVVVGIRITGVGANDGETMLSVCRCAMTDVALIGVTWGTKADFSFDVVASWPMIYTQSYRSADVQWRTAFTCVNRMFEHVAGLDAVTITFERLWLMDEGLSNVWMILRWQSQVHLFCERQLSN